MLDHNMHALVLYELLDGNLVISLPSSMAEARVQQQHLSRAFEKAAKGMIDVDDAAWTTKLECNAPS